MPVICWIISSNTHHLFVDAQIPAVVVRLHKEGGGGFNRVPRPVPRGLLDQGEIIVGEGVPPAHEIGHVQILLDVAELEAALLPDRVPAGNGFGGSEVLKCCEALRGKISVTFKPLSL